MNRIASLKRKKEETISSLSNLKRKKKIIVRRFPWWCCCSVELAISGNDLQVRSVFWEDPLVMVRDALESTATGDDGDDGAGWPKPANKTSPKRAPGKPHKANNRTDRTDRSDKANAAANTSGQTAEQDKEEAAGFLQQTREQMKNMAQGAVDSVKHTLGMDKK
ncbi:hypothetical protein V8G54_011341 [Vigna mungo]|uniref:Uncharacterized protein n=1 Tax=Vigna mungo TaxID=3915 RepID=A0AAQ3NPU8_VIGMU